MEKERERSDLRRGRDGTNQHSQRCGEGEGEKERARDAGEFSFSLVGVPCGHDALAHFSSIIIPLISSCQFILSSSSFATKVRCGGLI